ncbi:VirK/YbjX family protein [Pasteurella langaaensis]|nr:VirK/YbjX family protein [Pasteurella langaaensis]
MYAGERRFGKRVRSFIRYHFHTLLHRSRIAQFEQYLTKNSLWQPVFTQNYYRVNALLQKFCDRRFSADERLHAIQYSLDCAVEKLGEQRCCQLVEQRSLLIAQLTENWAVYLNINVIDPFEGFFSLNIKNAEGRSVYDASFTFLPNNQLLIASIQGPNSDDAQELVKAATKELHGMRPMYMLVNAFKNLAQSLGCELVGIAHKNQAKYRWNDHSKLLFNYDEFWQENDGVLNTQGYWALPLAVERKPLEEIQSKKRSMYRKRYEMFDVMAQGFDELAKK